MVISSDYQKQNSRWTDNLSDYSKKWATSHIISES